MYYKYASKSGSSKVTKQQKRGTKEEKEEPVLEQKSVEEEVALPSPSSSSSLSSSNISTLDNHTGLPSTNKLDDDTPLSEANNTSELVLDTNTNQDTTEMLSS